ncbi:hypothetical protein RHMOL_Rhmol04G0316000 [Rhododendron molle]|uniref:Uncharacterized protein n=1 Tax=Rhododendron molle TaxID=49168 RepID=A0ACC0P6N8_RHOML|nr:hypothetical protein RHMOL_Rhmol04G0316000 [Rhododendron molle]
MKLKLWNVIIPAESLDTKGLMLQKSITIRRPLGRLLLKEGNKISRLLPRNLEAHGVFLRSGSIENIYLSNQKMSDHKYVPGENPIFMKDKLSKIEKYVVVCFSVIGTEYIEVEREFQAVVSLEGDFLGPVS